MVYEDRAICPNWVCFLGEDWVTLRMWIFFSERVGQGPWCSMVNYHPVGNELQVRREEDPC
jgi:hypothetical protein